MIPGPDKRSKQPSSAHKVRPNLQSLSERPSRSPEVTSISESSITPRPSPRSSSDRTTRCTCPARCLRSTSTRRQATRRQGWPSHKEEMAEKEVEHRTLHIAQRHICFLRSDKSRLFSNPSPCNILLVVLLLTVRVLGKKNYFSGGIDKLL